MSDTEVNAILCPVCDHYVFSCAQHDCRHCPCGGVAIDGGPDNKYYRILGSKMVKLDQIKSARLVVPYTKQQMYDDWNHNFKRRKIGHVPSGEATRVVKDAHEPT